MIDKLIKLVKSWKFYLVFVTFLVFVLVVPRDIFTDILNFIGGFFHA